ncbi:MAG: class I SAM-dependent methyltransferase [Myxococcales bacterium]|nr:class I SAM-dependent methyltransferase [Myxococcales bacterium]MCB9718750.1 class I SAM-dependent methyltransferase [Myxococcales bacterium]
MVQRVARRLALGKEPRLASRHQRALAASFDALLERDWANAIAGIYPWSLLFQIPYSTYARLLPELAREIPSMARRRRRDDWKDLPGDVDLGEFPPYYRRTFHWQSDGYLSRRSAELYDLEVELLFGGTADVMRRQVLPPIVAHARGLGRPPRVLEVACGTGRTGAQLLRALPRADYTGVDLSPWYVEVARERMPPEACVELQVANGESLPFPDASFDAVFSVYLFHELPRNARRSVWAQMRRVLRPGGCLVVEDSLQPDDAGELGPFLHRFAEDMHEPFYRDYLRDDLSEGLRETGLVVDACERAFLSKVVCAHRPPLC